MQPSEEAKPGRFKSIVMLVISLASIGAFVYSEIPHKHKKHEAEEPDKHALHERTAAEPDPTSTVPPVTPMIAIASCTCISRANGKDTFVLERLSDDSAWHFKWEESSAALLNMTSSFWPGASDAGAATSLPRGATGLHAVMACEHDIVAVVAGDVASAWTGTDGELLWTRKLPAAYAFPSDAGVGAFDCAPALAVTGNVFIVPLVKGKTVALSIRDGSTPAFTTR